MSGSSSSFPYFPRRKDTISCLNLCITTILMNPNVTILGTLKVGDVLIVEIQPNAVVVTYGGQVVGEVVVATSDNVLEKLSDCIDEGTIYVADIINLNIQEQICQVKIHALRQ